MKKSFLIILSSVFALTGCELDISFARLFGKSDSENNNNQNIESLPDNQQQNENQNDKDTGSGDDNNEQQPVSTNEYTATINLKGSAMCSALGVNGTGFQFDSTNTNSENVTNLLNYLKSQLQRDNLLSSLYCVKLNTAAYEGSYCISLGTGYYLGDSGFNPGTFRLTSEVKISKVEVKAIAYFKEGWTADKISHIQINGDDHSLEVAEDQNPTLQTFVKEFNGENKTVELTSKGSRVLLDSIKITWSI